MSFNILSQYDFTCQDSEKVAFVIINGCAMELVSVFSIKLLFVAEEFRQTKQTSRNEQMLVLRLRWDLHLSAVTSLEEARTVTRLLASNWLSGTTGQRKHLLSGLSVFGCMKKPKASKQALIHTSCML